MEPKKTAKADLTKKSFLFFNVGLIVTLLLVNFAFTIKTGEDIASIDLSKSSLTEEPLPEVPVTEHVLPPPPPVIVQPIFKEVDDDEIIEDIPIDVDINNDPSQTPAEMPIVIDEPAAEDIDRIFDVVEESASPTDGMKGFYQFVSNKIKYPSQARRMGIEGRVFVEFVIERDGSITGVKAIKGIGGGCDEEAERIVASAAKWKPAKQRGKPVRQKMVLPIIFKLS